MYRYVVLLKIEIFLFLLFFICLGNLYSQRQSGIFYSTLYAKEGYYLKLKDFANNARFLFFEDVNGDGFDDAIAYEELNSQGVIRVAFSDGEIFQESENNETFMNIPEYWKFKMGDINGDKRKDILIIHPIQNDLWVMYSLGKKFSEPVRFKMDVRLRDLEDCFWDDLNDDGKNELIWYVKKNNKLLWYFVSFGDNNFISNVDKLGETPLFDNVLVSLNGVEKCIIGINDKDIELFCVEDNMIVCSKNIIDNESKYSNKCVFFIDDLDLDGSKDLILWDKESSCNWYVKYSFQNKKDSFQKFINNHLSGNNKNNVRFPQYGFIGTINGKNRTVISVSNGKWLGLEIKDKNIVYDPVVLNTYEAWGADYEPMGGTYDAGDTLVHMRQLEMIHDAGFTYITLDITNGYHDWIDSRAKSLMNSIRKWNSNLKEGQHKLYVNIALGKTRRLKDPVEIKNKFEKECERAWKEFYSPYKDIFYCLKGKPLVIHMLDANGWKCVNDLSNMNKGYAGKLCNRWMDGTQQGTKGKPNTYGWLIPGEYGNEVDKEMMPVMPGFLNKYTYWPRNNGEQYRTQWLKVLENMPESVWLNSFNETWEHTSVEPSHFINDSFSAHIDLKPWKDYYGNKYDAFYWDMTLQYNQLFMNNVLYMDSYIQEKGSDVIYKVDKKGFIKQNAMPVMKPVLLVPVDFCKNFNGKIIN